MTLQKIAGDDSTMRTTMPTPAQVRQLPELVRVRVPREWEDLNGHVNVQHHLTMYNLTTDPLLALLGISEEWVRVERRGLFDLEHHIWYLNEVHVGDEVSLHLRMSARNAKRVLGQVYLINATQDALASVIEFVSAAADLDARRTIPLPDVVASSIDDMLASVAHLDWAAPASGAISI
jgi:acyl-CoA thioester hydrolase